jgi:hypothetical protein
MADLQITQLTAYTTPISTDLFPIVDITNGVTKKITLAALGIILLVASDSQTGKTASITSTDFPTAYTPPANGSLYRISYYMVVTTGNTAGTVTFNAIYTDVQGARTIPGATTLNTTAAGNNAQGSLFFEAETSAHIKYSAILSGNVGTPTFNVYTMLERIK